MMTITTRDDAIALMHQAEGLEHYLERIAEFHSTHEDEYNEMMRMLDEYFLTEAQRDALDSFEGNSMETYCEALRLGVDAEFARWLYL